MNLKLFLAENPKKYIIFDFDETLVWMNLPWGLFSEMRHKALSGIGLDHFDSHTKRYLDVDAINELVIEHGKKVWDIERQMSEDFELNHLDGYEANNNLFDFIKQNKEKYTFYIWSSNTDKGIKKILKEESMLEYFEDIISKDDVELMKPYPDGFYKLIENLKEKGKQIPDRDEFLFVGNNPRSDRLAAEQAGIDFFLWEWTN
ncbi:HAD family hydrolase [Candidatus Dojkabacteria bacterium]|uniref:HAD family hydrolase n=1 Tax=Candidatus Dojkabacteria bacterium TaxID=2099670 RepID=A0A955IB16_9BACT|nr:HAD family hydrolase [Candidatus Dojkabacteria bacterium]